MTKSLGLSTIFTKSFPQNGWIYSAHLGVSSIPGGKRLSNEMKLGTPTLHTLFQRSKYGKLPSRSPSDRDGQTHEQRERFAMTALGFVLRHDKAYVKRFVQALEEVSGANNSGAIEAILIEKENWGDLIIQTENCYYVIEGKVRLGRESGLGAHQNPDEEDFWKGDKAYGPQIKKAAKEARCPGAYYIVLHQGESLALDRKDRALDDIPLKCFEMRWDTLDTQSTDPNGELVEDLFKLFAEVNISAFRAREAKLINLDMKDIIGAAKVSAMLVGVLKKFEVPEESAPMAAAFTEEEGWHVGLNLPKLSKARRLAGLVRNTGSNDVPGWFGYEAEVKDKYRRAVWFYCADESKANPLKVGLSANGYKVTDQKEIDEYTFSVTSDVFPEDPTKDCEWFIGVLDTATSI